MAELPESSKKASPVFDPRRANKAQAAQFFDISLPTLEKWLREGAPILQMGSRGVSWEIDLKAVAQWRYSSRSEGGVDPDSMPPQERKAWYESETKRRALQVQDRELIPSSEVESVVATAFQAISQGLRSLPDNIERRTGCSPDILEAIEAALDGEMDALADKLSSLSLVDNTDE